MSGFLYLDGERLTFNGSTASLALGKAYLPIELREELADAIVRAYRTKTFIFLNPTVNEYATIDSDTAHPTGAFVQQHHESGAYVCQINGDPLFIDFNGEPKLSLAGFILYTPNAQYAVVANGGIYGDEYKLTVEVDIST